MARRLAAILRRLQSPSIVATLRWVSAQAVLLRYSYTRLLLLMYADARRQQAFAAFNLAGNQGAALIAGREYLLREAITMCVVGGNTKKLVLESQT